MYRNSAHVKCIGPNALPSPDNTSDSDSELHDALDRKRRQLDEEIAKFRAIKDREFRDFERELRVKNTRSRAGSDSIPDLTPTKQPSSTSLGTASALNLLASTQNGLVNGCPGSKAKRDGNLSDKVKKPAPLSAPTISVEKLNIVGQTTPPLYALGTPPTTSFLGRVRSRSPSTVTRRPTTPPPSQLEKEPLPLSTPTPSKDRSDPFAGVFTPAFLPLLESRDQQPVPGSPPPPTSTDEEKQRLQLDAESKQHAEKQQLESSQSLPQQQVSPKILADERAKSTSVLPSSASLPSALRPATGGGGRGKRVMFQLADLKVVDPSSSYEEGPSPELEGPKEVANVKNDPFTTADPEDKEVGKRERRNPNQSKGDKDSRVGRGRGGRFISPAPSPQASPHPSPSPSPALRGSSPPSSPLPSPRLISSPDESGFSGGLTGADDGGSGVGFFELDEELASPGLRDGNPVETFDLDAEEMNEKASADTKGLGIVPSLQVGSLPIDIIKPSGSWVGSFGH